MSNFRFTTDWHSHITKHWETHLSRFRGKPAHMLELGSFEGRSALWALDHVLTHETSTIDCVDLWIGEYEKNFQHNMSEHPRGHRAFGHKMDVFRFLTERCVMLDRQWDSKGESLFKMYDIIYIDADHQTKSALTEAALCWRLLKPGGVMIFDDYPWQHPESDPDRSRKLGPKKGIDAFLECWQFELQVLHHGYQVIIQKK